MQHSYAYLLLLDRVAVAQKQQRVAYAAPENHARKAGASGATACDLNCHRASRNLDIRKCLAELQATANLLMEINKNLQNAMGVRMKCNPCDASVCRFYEITKHIYKKKTCRQRSPYLTEGTTQTRSGSHVLAWPNGFGLEPVAGA